MLTSTDEMLLNLCVPAATYIGQQIDHECPLAAPSSQSSLVGYGNKRRTKPNK